MSASVDLHDPAGTLACLAALFDPEGHDLLEDARRTLGDADHEPSDPGLRVMLDLFPDVFERLPAQAPGMPGF